MGQPHYKGRLVQRGRCKVNQWGQRCESHWPQLTRRAHRQSSQKFLDPASDRSRHAPLQLGVSVPGHSCPDPSASVTSDKPPCTCQVVLSAVWFFASWKELSSQENAFLHWVSGTPSLEDEGGQVGSLSWGHTQKVVAGSRLWLLLPRVRNPTPFKVFVENNNFLK